MSELKTLVAALKACDDMDTVMDKARSAFKIAANDAEFNKAAKSPKTAVAWILEEPNKDFLLKFLQLLEKKGFIGGSDEPAPRRAAAPAARGNGRAARATAAEDSAPRAGSKLDQAIKLMSAAKGVSKATLEAKVGVRADSCVWSVKQKGYTVENIGERGNPVYHIV